MTVDTGAGLTRTAGDPDISDPSFWLRPRAEIDAAFAELRARPGLPFYAEPVTAGGLIQPGPGYYAVTRHADIARISAEPQTFSSARGATSIPDLPPEFLDFFGGMINMDPPRHHRLRRIVSRAFTPRIIAQTEADIVTLARGIVDDLLADGPGEFVSRVAARLPLEVICRMMGLPPERYADVFRCTNVILGAADPDFIPQDTDIVAALLGAGAELADLLHQMATQRRADPTDDLTTALALAEVDGERLDNAEIASFFILLLVAGNETTRNAISHTLRALTQFPEQRAVWRDDLAGVTRTAVEEVVRWASPVRWMRRTATQDTELSGQQLRAGDKVLLFYSSANRDEAVFTGPDRFDVRRDPNPHVGFGGAGPHFCLGAHLARREIAVMWRELLTRAPDIRAVGEPEWLSSSFIHGIKRLTCDFTPR
ncbi:cytochrome P450 [Frankia sp. CNm7]|uniref:Cytochrome P450 n=1 Tax=Frankia nepalensis TaxID=1836974 RepID=A0A937UUM0_9ACTN|nr:cytochrome P450 [Frankia nepalensis]MBL7501116.1 cytochrome P450 [Frankia nepalensis]MBL7515070.1 cytochrome P450 [Frankia nepalensis]MBL7518797.1 cytochrome P450 [Frankia nepalensis]MBL7631306.1 cytochrome P450 [Frankia nepalensis]